MKGMSRRSGRFLHLYGVRRYSQSEKFNFQPKSFNIDEINDGNRANLELFQRLSRAYEILDSNVSFKYSTYNCSRYYETTNLIFFEDLLRFPRINTPMINFILKNFNSSSSIRALVLNDVFKAIILKNPELALSIFQKMMDKNQTFSTVTKSLEKLNNTKSDPFISKNIIPILANILLDQTIASGEPLLASAYAIQFHDTSIRVTEENLHNLILSLTVNYENNHLYHCYATLKLIDVFGTESLNTSDIELIMEFFLMDTKLQYFPNLVYDKLLAGESLNKCQESSFRKFRNKLIVLNIENGNIYKAFDIFNRSNIYPLCDHDMPMIELLLTKCQKNHKEIVSKLPPDVFQDHKIIDLLLKLYGANNTSLDKFENLVKTLKPPLRRLTLSLLFQSFLHQNKEKAAELVLQSIFKSKNGISDQEFNAIITKLLEQGQMAQCLTMVKTADIHVSKSAYISIFRRMLIENKLESAFLDDLYRKFLKLNKEDESFAQLSKNFIWFLSTRINNRLGKKYYNVFSEYTTRSEPNSDKLINLSQFGVPDKFYRLFRFSDKRIMVETLEIILHQSLKERDTSTVKWAIEELRFLGFAYQQIICMVKDKDEQGILLDIIRDDVLESCRP